MVKKVWTAEIQLTVRSDGVSAGQGRIVQDELVRVLRLIEDQSKTHGVGIVKAEITRLQGKVARG